MPYMYVCMYVCIATQIMNLQAVLSWWRLSTRSSSTLFLMPGPVMSVKTISSINKLWMGRMHLHFAEPSSSAELMETVDQIFKYPLSDAWSCVVCKDNFFNQRTLKRHQKRSHRAVSISYIYQCRACPQEFDNARRAAAHYQRHKKAASEDSFIYGGTFYLRGYVVAFYLF